MARAVLAAFSAAATLAAWGEIGEEGTIILRARQVTDTDGRVLDDFDAHHTEVWDDFTDEIDQLLDWLAELNGDDYLGEQTLDVGKER